MDPPELLTPLIKLSICQNSSPKCKTQGFQDSMRHGPSCSWHLSTDFLCILCLQLRPPNTTQMPAPPPPPRGGGDPPGKPPVYRALFWEVIKLYFFEHFSKGILWRLNLNPFGFINTGIWQKVVQNGTPLRQSN